ncbi:MAG: YdcF family protein [Clostridia bacterium]|nr:YdcF family protein [Clostridia bacterium]
MKLSQISCDEIPHLSHEQKTRIVFDATSQREEAGDLALLLGTMPTYWEERCRGAADLYFSGKVRYIMPTGGVCWEHEGRMVSEADGMREVLLKMGVPDDAIFLENEAQTTVENMIYGSLQMYRHFHFVGIKTVYVVTSPVHLTRSLVLARALLPRQLRILGYGGETYAWTRDHWQDLEAERVFAVNEIIHMRELIDRGLLDELEF